VTTTPAPPTGSKPRSELVAIADPDLPELARFIATQSGRAPAAVEAHLRWFLLENPARVAGVPLGWGLRSVPSRELVGCILCVPQVFRFRDQTFTVMGSSCFYVDASHRGAGGLIFLQYSRSGRRWPLFGNSANAEAAALWKASGAVPIPDTDHELFGVLHWSPVLEEVAARRVSAGGISRLAGKVLAPAAHMSRRLKLEGGDGVDLVPLGSAEQVMNLPIHGPSQKVAADRNLSYIRWRYFTGRDRTAELYAARSRQFETDILVAVNQRARGHRGQIRALHVLDIYPEVSAHEGAAIVGALIVRYRDRVDMVVLRGFNPSWQATLQAAGFTRRALDVPNGWFLDKTGLLPTRDWYTVPADGDWLI